VKKKIPIFIVCMLLIAFVIPASGIIGPDSKYDYNNDPETYRLKVKNLNDGRIAPIPGYLSDEIDFQDIIFNYQKISNPPKKTLGVKDETIIEVLNQIDETIILGYLENLTEFGPRVTGTTECTEAGDYIYNEFEEMGLDVRYHEWSYGGYSDRNIEGTLEGISETSDEIYIICAHYDSVPGSPGADDDGSGTVAVIAAAKIMSQYQFNHTIKFVAFSGEEEGLLGSHEYAREAASNGDNIIAALNADMIGFAITEDDGKNIKIYENDASEWITDFSIQVSEDYNEYIDLTLIPSGYSSGSDHRSFWEYGYDSIFYHEYNFNDYYHSPQDIIENMNITYSTKSSKLIIATLGELAQAQLIGEPPEKPIKPNGPTEGIEGQELTFSTSTTDPDGDQIYYKFDWGNDNYSVWLGPYNSGETIEVSNIWNDAGTYEVRVKAKDTNNRISDWSEPLLVIINNNLPPSTTIVEGPRFGRTGKSLTFKFTSTDPEDHDIYYFINWGDSTNDDWHGPYNSGDDVSINHTYNEGGQIFLNVKARDQYNKEGEIVHFVIFILKSRTISNSLFQRIINRFLNNLPRLQFLLIK
jgi:aminopeptidase YwaD